MLRLQFKSVDKSFITEASLKTLNLRIENVEKAIKSFCKDNNLTIKSTYTDLEIIEGENGQLISHWTVRDWRVEDVSGNSFYFVLFNN